MWQYERSMFSTTLLNNDDWLVKIGITERFKITLKDRNLTRRVSRSEGRHLVEVVKSMFNLQLINMWLFSKIYSGVVISALLFVWLEVLSFLSLRRFNNE